MLNYCLTSSIQQQIRSVSSKVIYYKFSEKSRNHKFFNEIIYMDGKKDIKKKESSNNLRIKI